MEIVLATRNKGKIRELEKLLFPLGIKVMSAADYPGFPSIVEDGKSFQENAVKKARIAANFTKQVALADDSGLEVDYLGGAPGIYSARFARVDCACFERAACSERTRAGLDQASCGSREVVARARVNCSCIDSSDDRTSADHANNEKLLALLKGVPWGKRTARFRCVVAVAVPGGKVYTAEGTCEGYIAFEPKGAGGFGYDPLFYLPDYDKTFAELDMETKNRVSHRGRALAGAVDILSQLVK